MKVDTHIECLTHQLSIPKKQATEIVKYLVATMRVDIRTELEKIGKSNFNKVNNE